MANYRGITTKNTTLFTVLIAVSAVCTYIISQQLLTKEVYYNSMSGQLSIDQINNLLNTQEQYQWLSYVLLVLFSAIKYALIATVLYTGVYLSGYKARFGQVLKVVLLAELLLLLPLIIKICWFSFVQTNYALEDIQYFYPLSALSLFDVQHLDNIWIYPFQLLNVFELAYWLVLAWGLQQVIQKDYDSSLMLVVKSYLPALGFWIVLVMFLTVTLN
ncbi:hypothetical protein [Olivibacter sitiensis]|uniref:hypothetical protein n=1 Tax=Olivibacter sitiensis TaxID=376470 RepID=UPI0003FEC547|nr:hypothetical protein [Olivibacter sitiensis]